MNQMRINQMDQMWINQIDQMWINQMDQMDRSNEGMLCCRHKTGERPPDEIQCLELQPGESGTRLDELKRR